LLAASSSAGFIGRFRIWGDADCGNGSQRSADFSFPSTYTNSRAACRRVCRFIVAPTLDFLGNCGRMGLYSQQFATRPISALAQKQTFGPRKRDVRFTPKRGHGSSRS